MSPAMLVAGKGAAIRLSRAPPRILSATAEEGVEVLDVVEQSVGATGVSAGENLRRHR